MLHRSHGFADRMVAHWLHPPTCQRLHSFRLMPFRGVRGRSSAVLHDRGLLLDHGSPGSANQTLALWLHARPWKLSTFSFTRRQHNVRLNHDERYP